MSFTPSASANSDPLAVRPRDACRLLSVGNTRLYQLIGSGELETYLDGRARRITMASIKQYIARRLTAATVATNERLQTKAERHRQPREKGGGDDTPPTGLSNRRSRHRGTSRAFASGGTR
jgi:excisionase family DNA binding protein